MLVHAVIVPSKLSLCTWTLGKLDATLYVKETGPCCTLHTMTMIFDAKNCDKEK